MPKYSAYRQNLQGLPYGVSLATLRWFLAKPDYTHCNSGNNPKRDDDGGDDDSKERRQTQKKQKNLIKPPPLKHQAEMIKIQIQKEKKIMKIIVVKPEKNPVVKEINGTLEEMQGIVGGFIQAVYPWRDDVALVCNEEGKISNLPLNRFIITESGNIIDFIAGTFFICYAPPEAENFQSLPEELIEKYFEKFKMKG